MFAVLTLVFTFAIGGVFADFSQNLLAKTEKNTEQTKPRTKKGKKKKTVKKKNTGKKLATKKKRTGKRYTSKKKTGKKYTSKKRGSKKKYTSKRKTKRTRNYTTPRYNFPKNNSGSETYTPPKSYDTPSDNTGRQYIRDNNTESTFKKEPKKEE